MKILLILLSIGCLVCCGTERRRSICGQIIDIGMCSEKFCAVDVQWQTGVNEIVQVLTPVMEGMEVYKRITTIDGELYNTWVSKRYDKQYVLTDDCPHTSKARNLR